MRLFKRQPAPETPQYIAPVPPTPAEDMAERILNRIDRQQLILQKDIDGLHTEIHQLTNLIINNKENKHGK